LDKENGTLDGNVDASKIVPAGDIKTINGDK